MSIKVRKLAVAAYIKMNGVKLLNYDGQYFIFDCDRGPVEWELEYLNSCCNKHDTELVLLRNLMKRGR